MDFKEQRTLLKLSQAELSRLSGVPRFRICTFELGDVVLKQAEHEKIRRALEAEASRLREGVAAAFC